MTAIGAIYVQPSSQKALARLRRRLLGTKLSAIKGERRESAAAAEAQET